MRNTRAGRSGRSNAEATAGIDHAVRAKTVRAIGEREGRNRPDAQVQSRAGIFHTGTNAVRKKNGPRRSRFRR